MDITTMGIREQRNLLDRHEISVKELTECYLNRIETYDPALQSYITVTKEQAYQDAETAQKAGVDFAGITHGMTTAEELKKYPHKKIMSSLEELLEREPLPAAASPKNISVRRIALLLLLLAAFAALFCFLLLI